MARNYKAEYENYHSKPEQKKRRAGRNTARRIMTMLKRVKKGDGKDVHHKDETIQQKTYGLKVRKKIVPESNRRSK